MDIGTADVHHLQREKIRNRSFTDDWFGRRRNSLTLLGRGTAWLRVVKFSCGTFGDMGSGRTTSPFPGMRMTSVGRKHVSRKLLQSNTVLMLTIFLSFFFSSPAYFL